MLVGIALYLGAVAIIVWLGHRLETDVHARERAQSVSTGDADRLSRVLAAAGEPRFHVATANAISDNAAPELSLPEFGQ